MNKLVSAMTVDTNRDAYTHNGAVTNKTSLSAVLDLFFIAGASRGKNITPQFALAHAENDELTARLALWMRDVRQGAGERDQFRLALRWFAINDPILAEHVARRVPDLGRWDDLFVLLDTCLRSVVIEMIRKALTVDGNGLCAKWMPRKGPIAVDLRNALGMTPKQYRKTIVNLSNTVEQKMCSGDWSGIEFQKVPSKAFSIYKNAFALHEKDRFLQFIQKVESGEQKIHAGAIFPHDVIRSLASAADDTSIRAAEAQWKNLPDFLAGTDENVLVVVDVSGSMGSLHGAYGLMGGRVQPIEVAVALGLYMSERLRGAFKDTFVTFSEKPSLQKVAGSLRDRMIQMSRADWGMTTNLQSVFKLILDSATKHNVPASDMPTKVLIVSDMEFDACMNGVGRSDTNYNGIKEKFASAGYELPGVVFWNVNGRPGNSPVTIRDKNAALVSGFSPSIAKSVLGMKELSPVDVMLNTLMTDRYRL